MEIFLTIRATARALLTKPAYLIVSIAVLGVSIAAQIAIVSVIDALVLRPPTASASQELAFVRSSLPGGRVSYPDFRDIQERMRSFTDAFAYYTVPRTSLSFGDEAVTVRCGVASGSYFPTLGVAPARGRLLAPGDDVDNAAPVAVISYKLSRQHGLDVGSLIRINTRPFTVVGVLPSEFRGIERTVNVDVWMPTAQLAAVSPAWVRTNRGSQGQTVVGRLKPGVSLATASAELAVLADALQQENAAVNHGMGLRAQSFASFRYDLDDSARIMVLLGALVWLLFGLGFTNFFALTLLRLLARRRELAVKLAIGATRGHLGRGLLAELGIIGSVALAAGIGVGAALLHLLRRDPAVNSLVEAAVVRVDGRSVLIVAASVVVCAVAVWLLLVREAGRVDVLSALKEQATAPRRKIAFAGLFALQFAIALFLLATAGSFVDGLRSLVTRPYPFATDNVLLFDVHFPSLGVAGKDRVPVAEKILTALRGSPAVRAVGASASAPLGGAGWTNVVVREKDPALEPDKGFANWTVVTSDYFTASGIRLQQGRAIEAHEIASGARVAVVNASMARRYWPEGNALGQSFKPWASGPVLVIVGVADDVPANASLTVLPQIYLPWTLSSSSSLVFHVAVHHDSAATRQAITANLRDIWPTKTPPPLHSVREQIDRASADLVTAVGVTLWLAGFATLVTSCGLYFFSAYAAAQTMRDAAIRQALGASPVHLLRAHLARYRIGLAAGALGGLGLVFAARPLFAAAGVKLVPMRPEVVAIAVAVLLIIAFVGLCLPLRQLLRLDLSRILSDGG